MPRNATPVLCRPAARPNLNGYSARFGTQLTLAAPAHERVHGILDTFLDDPQPGFQKNSFQFTLGLTYVLR